MINANQGLLADYFALPADDDLYPRDARHSEPQTWILLHYEDESLSEVRVELSLPAGQATDGSIDAWTERITFPPIKIGARPVVTPAEELSDEIDIDVERRTS